MMMVYNHIKKYYLWMVLFLFSMVSNTAYAINCTFQAKSNVAFGSYNVFNAASDDSVGGVTYRCSGVTGSQRVTIDLSKGNSNDYNNRYMLNGVNKLFYNLYIDSARTQIWGDGVNSTRYYGPLKLANNTSVPLTIYGRIPAQQDASVGTYSDTIIVTMNFN
jgi:spore coat protein U-like protein